METIEILTVDERNFRYYSKGSFAKVTQRYLICPYNKYEVPSLTIKHYLIYNDSFRAKTITVPNGISVDGIILNTYNLYVYKTHIEYVSDPNGVCEFYITDRILEKGEKRVVKKSGSYPLEIHLIRDDYNIIELKKIHEEICSNCKTTLEKENEELKLENDVLRVKLREYESLEREDYE
jgi:hypothetical protein